MSRTPKRIDLRIGEIVLEGIGARDRHRVLESIEQQLAGHLARGEYPRESQTHVTATRPSEGTPAALGRHVARVIAKRGEP